MNNTKTLVLCGFGMAVIFVLTAFIAIPIGQFGYINLGDCGVMLFASLLNPVLAFLCGGIGSALSDLYLGYSQYAIFTFIIKGFEAITIAFLYQKIRGKAKPLSYLLGVFIIVIGYFLTDTILLQNATAAFGGVTFNLLQGMISFIIAAITSFFFIEEANKHLK